MSESSQDPISSLAERVIGDSQLRTVPLARVLEEFGTRASKRLAPKDYQAICRQLGEAGVGIEPDPDCTGVYPRTGEQVVLFRLDGQARGPVSAEFLSAAAVLGLAVGVAQADNEVVAQEEAALERHLETSLALNDGEGVRLQAWLNWLVATRPRLHLSLLEAKETLRALPEAERQGIAALIVRVAAADEVVNLKEIDFLRKAYAALAMEDEELEVMLKSTEDAYVFASEAGVELPPSTSVPSSEAQAGTLLGILFGEPTT
jgi:hypothetical protein